MSRRLRAPRGVALLMAMLVVLMVTVLASATLWQRQRQIDVEAAERVRVQASALLVGAVDWARLILREDLRSGTTDHLSEPWSVGLEESRLSSFLAADSPNTALLDDSEDVFLSGRILDEQSRFNLTGLTDAGRLVEAQQQALLRLFEALELPSAEAVALAENWRFSRAANQQSPGDRMALLRATRIEDLVRFGVSAGSIAVLQDHLTVLPVATPVNLNTASPEVIFAAFPLLTLDQAREVVRRRAREPLKTVAQLGTWLPVTVVQLNEGRHAVGSKFFRVMGRLRMGDAAVEELALIQRESLSDVRIVWRQRASRPIRLGDGQSRSIEAILQSVK